MLFKHNHKQFGYPLFNSKLSSTYTSGKDKSKVVIYHNGQLHKIWLNLANDDKQLNSSLQETHLQKIQNQNKSLSININININLNNNTTKQSGRKRKYPIKSLTYASTATSFKEPPKKKQRIGIPILFDNGTTNNSKTLTLSTSSCSSTNRNQSSHQIVDVSISDKSNKKSSTEGPMFVDKQNNINLIVISKETKHYNIRENGVCKELHSFPGMYKWRC